MTRNELRDLAMLSARKPEDVLAPMRPGSTGRIVLVILLLIVAGFALLQWTGGGTSPSPTPGPSPSIAGLTRA